MVRGPVARFPSDEAVRSRETRPDEGVSEWEGTAEPGVRAVGYFWSTVHDMTPLRKTSTWNTAFRVLL